jgi:hypothetical protein
VTSDQRPSSDTRLGRGSAAARRQDPAALFMIFHGCFGRALDGVHGRPSSRISNPNPKRTVTVAAGLARRWQLPAIRWRREIRAQQTLSGFSQSFPNAGECRPALFAGCPQAAGLTRRARILRASPGCYSESGSPPSNIRRRRENRLQVLVVCQTARPAPSSSVLYATSHKFRRRWRW